MCGRCRAGWQACVGCGKITHVEPVETWSEVGERVRQARLAVGLTQAELARRIGMERSALVRAEGGERRLDALELFRVAEALELPVRHFLSRPPAAVISRRSALAEGADAAARERYLLDADLEAHLADTSWLVDHALLHPPEPPPASPAGTVERARALARETRRQLGLAPSDPVGPVAAACEQFSLYLHVVDRDADGASLLADTFGVAVIGGRSDPGRRRFTGAHELGHHLLGDAYHSDAGVAASLDQREQIVHAFAAELLIPDDVLHTAWQRDATTRERLIWLAGTYRVSWSVALGAAHRAGLVPPDEHQRLRADTPRRGEFLAVLGAEPVEDLTIGEVGPAWQRAVLAGWQSGELTAARTVELLHSRLDEDDLPERSLQPDP